MISIMDLITIVTVALVISLILLGVKLNIMYKKKKAAKREKMINATNSEVWQKSIKPMEKTYENIIKGIEEGLLKAKKGDVTQEQFREGLDRFKLIDLNNFRDEDIFWMITSVMFLNMGKKASSIEKLLPVLKEYLYGYERVSLLEDEEIINIAQKFGFDKQIRWCRDNAVVFKGIIEKYGSFLGYMSQEFNISDNNCTNEELTGLHKDLKLLFEGIGEASGWQLIGELGFFPLKPDKSVKQVFYRLGLVKNEEDIQGIVDVGKDIARTLQTPIRYIGLLFEKFGQAGESDSLGISDGICTEKNPKCTICTLTTFCNYYIDSRKKN